jgi:hypothetical protein
MRSRGVTTHAIGAMFAAALLLGACGGDDEPTDTETADEQTVPDEGAEPVDQEPVDEEPVGDEPDTDEPAADGPVDEPAADDDPASEGPADEPADDGDVEPAADGGDSPFQVRTGEVEVEEVEAFDSGVQVAVTGLTVEPMAIFVEVEVLNGWTDDVTFADFSDPRLEDNTGRGYVYVAPDANVELRVPAGGTLSATLAFQGALNPSANGVTLELNRNSAQDSRPDTIFRDLPLPEAS